MRYQPRQYGCVSCGNVSMRKPEDRWKPCNYCGASWPHLKDTNSKSWEEYLSKSNPYKSKGDSND